MNAIKTIGRKVRGRLRESRAKVLRRLGMLRGDWSSALRTEVSFWEKALRDPQAYWIPEEFQKRTDPDSELQNELQALIDVPPGSAVRILDVGAGPLTTLGKHWSGRQLEIVAIDPLAEAYDGLLARLSIRPPVRTRFGHAEKLLDYFRRDEFDLAYSSNALDHSYDPVTAIRQMFAVVKPGAFVYLWHFANEGVVEGYGGLHQWNFDVHKGDFIISDGRSSVALSAKFIDQGSLTCETTHAFGKRVVIAKLKKSALR